MPLTITNAVITFYCSCTLCCGPKATGITASGLKPKENLTIAGPRQYKLGTKVTIGGRQYIIQDRTARRYDGRWDIYVNSHAQALKLGIWKNQTVNIKK